MVIHAKIEILQVDSYMHMSARVCLYGCVRVLEHEEICILSLLNKNECVDVSPGLIKNNDNLYSHILNFFFSNVYF